MPSQMHSLSPRRLPLLVLAAMILLCGVLLHSSSPGLVPEEVLYATPVPTEVPATPSPTQAPTFTPYPTMTPTPTVAPTFHITPAPTGETSAPTEEPPVILITESPSPRPTRAPATTAPPQQTPTVVPTETIDPIAQVLAQMSEEPTSAPDYVYTNDDVRVEVRRHEEEKNVVYFAIELWLTDVKQLRSAFSSERFDGPTESVQDIAERNNAIVAINGDFATFNDGGIILRDGVIYRTNRSTRQMLAIDANGDFIPYIDAIDDPDTEAAMLSAAGVWQTLVFGPVLVADGEAVPLPKKFIINTSGALEPRTAIAQLGPLHYLILVVDGRQSGYSQGVSLARLQELFIEHGAITAFNLDGGGSTTLYYDGEIINKPANGGQRKVPDILFVER